MVVQGLQHDIHGERKQAAQEDVENYIEEKYKACRQKEKGVVSTGCNISKKCNEFNRPYTLCALKLHLILDELSKHTDYKSRTTNISRFIN